MCIQKIISGDSAVERSNWLKGEGVGDIIEVVRVLLCCAVWFVVCGITQNSLATSLKDEFVIRTFEDLYEPSAVVAVQGQGVVILEDDGPDMLSLHSVVKDGSGFKLKKQKSDGVDVDVTDIEGAASSVDGTVFAITSHSLNKKNQRNEKREQLIQLKVQSGLDTSLVGSVGLRDGIVGELLKIDPVLGDQVDEVNIEGLCFSKTGKKLLIGLRAPLYKGKAIVLFLETPNEVISDSFTAQFSGKPLLLDLGGAGIRAMAYSESSGEYFFVSEVETKKKKMRPRLWAWNGETGHDVVRMDLPGLKKLKNIEGLTFLRVEEDNVALLVCDDGSKKKNKGAHYAIVDMREIKEK